MGRSRQPRPEKLAEKLKEIRLKLGLTQQQMFEILGYTKTALYVGHISLYEKDERVPPLLVLLHYARAAKLPLEFLIDDDLELPEILPNKDLQELMLRIITYKK